MQWISLNSRHLKAACYDPDRQRLFIKTTGGSVRRYTGILPHMFENLIASDDQQFYCRIYIEPSLVSDRPGPAKIAAYLLKVGVVGAGALLLSAPGLVL